MKSLMTTLIIYLNLNFKFLIFNINLHLVTNLRINGNKILDTEEKN